MEATCIVDMTGVTKVIEGIEHRAHGLDLGVYAEDVKVAVDDLIQAQGARNGRARWHSLAPATLRLHPNRAGGSLLQASGLLANVQTGHGSNWFGVRSPAAYSGFHVTGTMRYGKQYMPARDFLDIDFNGLLEVIANDVNEKVMR